MDIVGKRVVYYHDSEYIPRYNEEGKENVTRYPLVAVDSSDPVFVYVMHRETVPVFREKMEKAGHTVYKIDWRDYTRRKHAKWMEKWTTQAINWMMDFD